MSLTIFQMLELTGQALSVQRTRLDVASGNLANAQTTRTPEGGPFRRREVVLAADRLKTGDFQSALDHSIRSVRVAKVQPDKREPTRVFEPGHPDADGSGYVYFPNVNTVEEMVNMTTAMRSYQANLKAFQAFREMADLSFTLGRGTA